MVRWQDVTMDGADKVWIGTVEGLRLDLTAMHPEFPEDWVLSCPMLNAHRPIPICRVDMPSRYAMAQAEKSAWQMAMMISLQMGELAKVLDPEPEVPPCVQEAAE